MDVTRSQFGLLAQLLDGSALRQKVIANNVANVNTPNYKRLEVSFEKEFAAELAKGSEGAGIKLKIAEDANAVARVDGNTVNMDTEMAELNKNSMLFAAAAQILSVRIAMMRSAISGQ